MENTNLMKATEVAERLCTTNKFVYHLINRGELGCYRLGDRNIVRISQEQLNDYLERSKKDSDG